MLRCLLRSAIKSVQIIGGARFILYHFPPRRASTPSHATDRLILSWRSQSQGSRSFWERDPSEMASYLGWTDKYRQCRPLDPPLGPPMFNSVQACGEALYRLGKRSLADCTFTRTNRAIRTINPIYAPGWWSATYKSLNPSNVHIACSRIES